MKTESAKNGDLLLLTFLSIIGIVMTVLGIKVITRGLDQLIEVLKMSTFEYQGTQLLSTGFHQVKTTDSFETKPQLQFRSSSEYQFGFFSAMYRQTVFNDQSALNRQGGNHLLKQLHVTSTVPTSAEAGNFLPYGWLKRIIHPLLPTLAIIRLTGGLVRACFSFFPWIGLERNHPSFIQPNHTPALERELVGSDHFLLFSTNSIFAFSPLGNKLSFLYGSLPFNSFPEVRLGDMLLSAKRLIGIFGFSFSCQTT